jgi:hypothetical protein
MRPTPLGTAPATQQQCIYCCGSGPFTNEHVFSAGLGGDDDAFLLRNLVCKDCNEKKFSPMETEFMRNSPDAFSRVFLQPRGRDRGKATKGPRFRPESVRIFLPNGDGAEAEIRAGGRVIIVPQFVLEENKLRGQATDPQDLKDFLDLLSALLTLDTLPVVTKTVGVGRAQFYARDYRWDGRQYEPLGRRSILKPPNLCIWRDERAYVDAGKTVSRVFRHPDGQVLFRRQGSLSEAGFLSILRRNLASISASAAGAEVGTPIQNSPIAVRLFANIALRERVLAKIGVNMCAMAYGESFVRQPCFDAIRRSILTGVPAILCTEHRIDMMAAGEFLAKLFAAIPKNNHVGMLVAMQPLNGVVDLFFCVRLYGGVMTMVRLASNVPAPIPHTPIFMMVDYLHHKVKLVDNWAFTTEYLFPNLAPVE